MSDKIVGIDLGTTNSVVAFTRPDGNTDVFAGKDNEPILPSIVVFDEDGTPIVGKQAKSIAGLHPERHAILFKRGMGQETFQEGGAPFTVDGKAWRPEELSALVLKKLMDNASHELGEQVSKAVITVPAYFGAEERRATENAGKIAGVEVVRLINEPTAAAFVHGLENQAQGRYLVFDLGGGTFDVTIMDVQHGGDINVVSTGGDHRLGGSDFDLRIAEWMYDRIEEATGTDVRDSEDPEDLWIHVEVRQKAEDLKIALSTKDKAMTTISPTGRPIKLELTRAQFEEMLESTATRIESEIQLALDAASIQAGEITQVIMVGGSSRIPMFQDLLKRMFGKEPIFTKKVDEDVARGAAMVAALGNKEEALDSGSMLASLSTPVDATSHGIGITLQGRDKILFNNILIPKNTALPASVSEAIQTVSSGTKIQISLNEGDSPDLDHVKQLGESTGTFDSVRPARYPLQVEVTFAEDQTVHAKLYDGKTKAFLTEVKVNVQNEMSDAALADAGSLLASLKVE